jgi:outer membrane protein assembly factor BamB
LAQNGIALGANSRFTAATMQPSQANAVRLGVMLAMLLGFGPRNVCAAEATPTNLWTCRLTGYNADSTPAVAPDGTIYQATFEGHLLAFTPQGKKKWDFQVNSEIKSSPAIADDGTIYFGSRDWKFYAVSPQGDLEWTFQTGAWVDSSPAIGADGTIYFGSWDTNFYALNPDGTKKWSFPSGGIIDSSPAIGADGTVYFGSHDKKFYALTPAGAKKWAFATGGQIGSSPALGADGTIYFSSTDGNLYALRPDGTERWRLHTGGATWSSPVLDEKGNIYLAANKHGILISSEGKKRLDFDYSPVLLDATPALAANGDIYCSAPWRKLCAFQPDGRERWHVDTVANLVASPTIGDDGTVFICDGQFLCAVNSLAGLPLAAKSPWPMFRANPRHTGRVNLN